MDNLVEMNWTNQELEIWIKAGLVPMHLLNPENHLELINFLRTNKEKLHACYKRNPEEDYYQMQVPPQSEWHNAPDIPVIDTRTGKVLYSLEMAGEFELCEGICLKIKAKELEDWKKETAEAKQLTAEQNKELKAFLSKYGTERPLSRKEIATFIEEIKKPSKSSKI